MIFSINHRSTRSFRLTTLPKQMIQSRKEAGLDDGCQRIDRHSACPYYMSQVSKHAELVLSAYNYVLDPPDSKSLGIGLDNTTVVVLDQNSQCRRRTAQWRSGVWVGLCGMIAALQYFAGATVGPLAEMTVNSKDRKTNRMGAVPTRRQACGWYDMVEECERSSARSHGVSQTSSCS
jgi:hypothetical protein